MLHIDAGETLLAAGTSTATGSALLKRSKCVPAPMPVCRAPCVRIAPERFDVVGDVVGEWWLWAVVHLPLPLTAQSCLLKYEELYVGSFPLSLQVRG